MSVLDGGLRLPSNTYYMASLVKETLSIQVTTRLGAILVAGFSRWKIFVALLAWLGAILAIQAWSCHWTRPGWPCMENLGRDTPILWELNSKWKYQSIFEFSTSIRFILANCEPSWQGLLNDPPTVVRASRISNASTNANPGNPITCATRYTMEKISKIMYSLQRSPLNKDLRWSNVHIKVQPSPCQVLFPEGFDISFLSISASRVIPRLHLQFMPITSLARHCPNMQVMYLNSDQC